MRLIENLEKEQMRKDLTELRVGANVRVHVKIQETGRERIQVFQGVIIRRQGAGLRETFTVRKISFGVGVERTFPLHSPRVVKVEVLGQGHVRRAKLYYLRKKIGKRAQLREKRTQRLEGFIETEIKEEVKEEPEVAEEVKPKKRIIRRTKSQKEGEER